MELLDKGKHCQEEYCHQLDLLPMKCKVCHNYYCSEHFKYESHNCKESFKLNYKIPTCEHCSKTIEFKRGKDLDLCLAEHMQKCLTINAESSTSSSNNLKSKTNKNHSSCYFNNCKSSKQIFSFECETCLKKYCNKHRLPEDHKCSELQQQQQQQQLASTKTSSKPATTCSKQFLNTQNKKSIDRHFTVSSY